MAARFWVGGAGTWDSSSTTNWSATSGGAGGASVPGSADTVTFDASSGSGTVTFTNGGVTVSAVTINSSSITLSLGAAFSVSTSVTLTIGTFTTNDYAVTASSISSSNGNARTFNLGASTITLNNSVPFNTGSNTGLTFNAGTSTFVFTSTGSQTISNGVIPITFYNVSFTGAGSGTITLSASAGSSYTFNNLSVAAAASASFRVVTFSSPCTINGTLSTTGTAGNRRVLFQGANTGIAQTLTINSAPSLTDADFRDIYVIGTAAPISGTRIGDLRGTRGITFSAPKTVYWNLAAGGNWSSTSWAASAGGSVSDDYFPLAQDTATFVDTGLNSGATVTWNAAITYSGTVDMSARTLGMTINCGAVVPIIHGDWINGSGSSVLKNSGITFSGRKTQTITSFGKTFSGSGVFTIDSYGGTVQLADALSLNSVTLFVTNGTFDSQGYSIDAGLLSSNNSNVRAISLGASTVTLNGGTAVDFTTSTNLSFTAGTSQINCSAGAVTFTGGGCTFNNVTMTSTSLSTVSVSGANTFANLTVTPTAANGLVQCNFAGNQIVTGSLTVSGATAVRRIAVQSNIVGTQRDLTVGTLVATDCDFRDIEILGAAAGSSPTRAGNLGGNANITFPSPKTVYWNLAGAQNWSAIGWASSSGGTPDINNFPLPQDTAVFDDTGAAGTVTIDVAWNIGTVDMSARTSAMTFSVSTLSPRVYGDWKWGTGVTSSSTTGTLTFSSRGTEYIVSNGVTFGCNITVDSLTGTTQLSSAFAVESGKTFTLTSGTFDAVSYNVTCGLASVTGTTARTLKMGSGTWTLSGTGTVWNATTVTSLTFYKGTADIVLSNTNITARTFAGGGLSYNKLTIGGTTGVSSLTFSGNNQFTELASTKTVAHTIALGTTAQTVGAWTITGTVGNVVTITGTATITVAGARVSGVDYLAYGTTTASATSPGEFYAGANSTGTGANIIKTAAPAAVTRYWVGGTGTWDATTTTNWSATSGGAGGASVPTSADAVVFDSASSATAYTVTCTATQLRCAALTMAGPASGNITWAGTAPLAIHDNVSLSATGITRSYTGAITLTGSTTGKTFTTNGVALSSTMTINGVGCGWTLGSALSNSALSSSTLTITNGGFDTSASNYALTVYQLTSSNSNTRSVTFNGSTVSAPGISFPAVTLTGANLSLNAGTSTISIGGSNGGINVDGMTVYNVTFGAGATSNFIGTGGTGAVYNNVTVLGGNNAISVYGNNTFNSLSIAGRTTAGLSSCVLYGNQTIGTLTFTPGTDATMRTFVKSDTFNTVRTISCTTFSATDYDFQDITITGAAAPVSGTRLGDCKNTSGITFPAPKTVYWNLAAGGNWGGAIAWATTSGGTPAINNFPLAQDTAIVESTGLNSAATVTVNVGYNIGTIDMSARTGNTMTLATGSTAPIVYGNWINGTGTTLSGTGAITFAGRGSQTITSAGVTFTQPITINNIGGSATLQDAFTSNNSSATAISVSAGTFAANTYAVTLTGAASGVSVTGTTTRSIGVGSGTWTIVGTNGWNAATATNLTVTGTGTISLTNAGAKTFAGGGISYANVTLNQGGAGALTITGNNTFANITNTYKSTGATSIAFGSTTQTVTQWTAAGEAGRLLTISGTSAAAPATLVFSGGSFPNVDYLSISNIRAYALTATWYAGANSVNNGSLGWYFSSTGGVTIAVYITESVTTQDISAAIIAFNRYISEATSAADVSAAVATFRASVADVAAGLDTARALGTLNGTVTELSTGADALTPARTTRPAIAESVIAQEQVANTATIYPAVSESGAAVDALQVIGTYTVAATAAAQAADAEQATNNASASLAESATAAEQSFTRYSGNAQIAEQLTALEQTRVAPSVFKATAAAAVSVFDVASAAGSVFNAALPVESAAAADSMIGAYLWNVINDAQTAGWQNVNSAETTSWGLVGDSSVANWQNVDSADAGSWGADDNSQDPGWKTIPQ